MIKLYDHQRQGIDFLLSCKGNGALFWDMGTGKTVTALKTFETARQYYPDLKLLVICPLSLIESAWQDDTTTFTDFTFGNLRKLKTLKQYNEADVLCCNYDMVASKKGFIRIRDIVETYNCYCVLDESSKCKNHKSSTYKNLSKLAPHLKFRTVMSGTPCPNSYTELWSQLRFIQPDLLPSSFYKFRNLYFHLSRGTQKMDVTAVHASRMAMAKLFKQGWGYDITETKQKSLFAIIKPYTFWLKKEDCVTLPEVTDETRLILMSSKQKRIYKEMKRDLISILNDTVITAPMALTKIIKLRQITGNFLKPESGAEINIDTNNPKLTELKSTLEDIGNKQVIIWAVFRQDIKNIVAILQDKDIGTLCGDTKDKTQTIKDFQTNKIQYLIANPQSAAHGLTFVNCSYSIYYSLDYSWENYIQSKNRIHRIGQTNKCTYIHLLMQDTIDQIIYEVLCNKGNINKIIERFMRGK